MRERFNYLIELSNELSIVTCTRIIFEMSKLLRFDHDEVTEVYDSEDKEYGIYVHIYSSEPMLDWIKNYLDNHGLKNQYDIYKRLSN